MHSAQWLICTMVCLSVVHSCFIAEWYSIWIHHFIFLWMDIWVVFCFELLWIAAMNTLVKFINGHIFYFSWVDTNDGIARLKYMVNVMINCQTLFQSHFIILHSHQQIMWIAFASHPCWHLVLSVFNFSHSK